MASCPDNLVPKNRPARSVALLKLPAIQTFFTHSTTLLRHSSRHLSPLPGFPRQLMSRRMSLHQAQMTTSAQRSWRSQVRTDETVPDHVPLIERSYFKLHQARLHMCDLPLEPFLVFLFCSHRNIVALSLVFIVHFILSHHVPFAP